MNILLVVPPFIEEGLEMAAKESIGVCYLAALLRRNNFPVDIVDADLLQLSPEQTIDLISQHRYDLIGFSVLEGTIEPSETIIRGLRRRAIGAHLVLGGYFPTLAAEETLTRLDVDSIILGEGELTLLELAQCLASGEKWQGIAGLAYRDGTRIIVNEARPASELDNLPFPARDLLPEVLQRGGTVGVVGSRGCFGKCSFCCINSFNNISRLPAWRGRSPANVVDEIEELQGKWGVDSISFYDSNFIGPGRAGEERAAAIADEIIKRGLRLNFAISTRPDQIKEGLFRRLQAAGLTEVFIGIESMSQKSLDLYRKNITVAQNWRAVTVLERLGIFFRPGFILYEPYISLAQVKENITYLHKLYKNRYCRKYHFFKALRVYRGSPMEDILGKNGILIRNGWHTSYTWQDPDIKQFIQLTGQAGAKMMPLLEKIRNYDLEAKDYLTNLIGSWSLETYEKILEVVEEADSSARYIDIIVNAEKQLGRIYKLAGKYTASPGYEREAQLCSMA